MHDTCDDTDVVHVRRIDCDCQRSCGMFPVHKYQALPGQHNTKQQLAPLWNSTLSGQTSSGEGTDDKLSGMTRQYYRPCLRSAVILLT